MIHICNWLLTRKCNLKCSYCGIAQNKPDKPPEYPDVDYYYKNEMSTEYVKNTLDKIKKHNPNCFHIFYGGEPLLRKDLFEIINHCNQNDIHYTIISNNTEELDNKLKFLIDNTDEIKGFTASVDPVIYDYTASDDIKTKSLSGYNRLLEMKKYCKDVVAEVTVTNRNKKHLYRLIEDLHNNGINSDITFIDAAKNPYYDFSNIYHSSMMVWKDPELDHTFNKIIKNNLNVHMANILLPEIWNILPSNLDCKIEENLHNITIESDGSLRLCLRIKGTIASQALDMFNDDMSIKKDVMHQIITNKIDYCQLCNWTCMIMSKLTEQHGGYENLIHIDKRG